MCVNIVYTMAIYMYAVVTIMLSCYVFHILCVIRSVRANDDDDVFGLCTR